MSRKTPATDADWPRPPEEMDCLVVDTSEAFRILSPGDTLTLDESIVIEWVGKNSMKIYRPRIAFVGKSAYDEEPTKTD